MFADDVFERLQFRLVQFLHVGDVGLVGSEDVGVLTVRLLHLLQHPLVLDARLLNVLL